LRPGPEQNQLSKYLYENLSPPTQQLLSSQGNPPRLRSGLAMDLNRLLTRERDVKQRLKAKEQDKTALDQAIADGTASDALRKQREQLIAEIAELSQIGPLYEPARFKPVPRSEYLADFIKENPQGSTRIRLNRLLLEAAYPAEVTNSPGGLYPDREIYIPTSGDLDRCYSEYLDDVGRRTALNQLEPGENVTTNDNRLQISGQISVMNINGLLAKMIFDRNPKNEFFVEESFPLKWMYPYLTPFGIIMKVNRQPLPALTEDILRKDHAFWSKYSDRLIGNWINYDTPVKEIAAFAERVYLHRDFTGFKGDRKFVRDDQGQKAFSKLRSSIAGVYAWRFSPQCPPEYRPKTDAEFQRLVREADFAFRQAFAFCPYSPEAVFHYVNLLCSLQRFDDALLVVSTCQKLDPFNGQVNGVVKNLQDILKRPAGPHPTPSTLPQLEKAARDNPTDFQAAFNLAGAYLQLQQTGQALQVLERVLNHPQAKTAAFRALVQAYASFGHLAGLQKAVEKLEALVRADPANSPAAIVLAEAYRHLNKPEAAIRTLDQVINHPKVDGGAVLQAAQQYAELADPKRMEAALDKATKLAPNLPEAWYDLAAIKTMIGKSQEALPALRRALDLSAKRLASDPKAHDLLAEARRDPNFAPLRQTPEFKQLTAPK
jgi:tetratricopeptide (TPR) repeat protein